MKRTIASLAVGALAWTATGHAAVAPIELNEIKPPVAAEPVLPAVTTSYGTFKFTTTVASFREVPFNVMTPSSPIFGAFPDSLPSVAPIPVPAAGLLFAGAVGLAAARRKLGR